MLYKFCYKTYLWLRNACTVNIQTLLSNENHHLYNDKFITNFVDDNGLFV